MYDTVHVPCPKCGTKSGFQSKGGDCSLADYELETCPADVMEDINRHAPNICHNCGAKFRVDFKIAPASIVYAKAVLESE